MLVSEPARGVAPSWTPGFPSPGSCPSPYTPTRVDGTPVPSPTQLDNFDASAVVQAFLACPSPPISFDALLLKEKNQKARVKRARVACEKAVIEKEHAENKAQTAAAAAAAAADERKELNSVYKTALAASKEARDWATKASKMSIAADMKAAKAKAEAGAAAAGAASSAALHARCEEDVFRAEVELVELQRGVSVGI